MAGVTTDKQFKKTEQTVGGGDNNSLKGNFNDQMFKEHKGSDGNINDAPHRSADSAIERDLETKGYTTRNTDAEIDEVQEMRSKLDKRGNLPQEGADIKGL